MKLHNMLPFRRSAFMRIALTISTIHGVSALSQEYCSTENTGSSFAVVNDIYQSNGACHDTCNGQYAFAIVQWQNCWCSNYVPAQQSDLSDCDQTCPGYPDELCGNSDTSYFGYIALDTAPSGTAGAVAASSTSTTPSSTPQSSTEEPETSYVSETVVQTVTQSPSVMTSYVTPTPTPTPTTTSTQHTTSSIATSSSPAATIEVVASPVTSVFMTTISGAVVTQTVTSTPIAASGSNSGDNLQVQRDNGLGAGAIAGIVLGVLIGLALIGLAAFLLWRRRRNQADGEKQPASPSGSKRDMQRNVSVLSKAGLLGGVRPSTGEREADESYGMTGSNSVRHSMMYAGADGISPVSPLDSSHSTSSRRPSKPMVYDQRLNPSALFANQEANGSRISMQDTQDYSRPLGVMNPDPRSSFESRLSHQ